MAEIKEFEPQLKFETQLKYGWFQSKLYSMFQDLSRRSNNANTSEFENKNSIYYKNFILDK